MTVIYRVARAPHGSGNIVNVIILEIILLAVMFGLVSRQSEKIQVSPLNPGVVAERSRSVSSTQCIIFDRQYSIRKEVPQ
jgi:hypothetical protein